MNKLSPDPARPLVVPEEYRLPELKRAVADYLKKLEDVCSDVPNSRRSSITGKLMRASKDLIKRLVSATCEMLDDARIPYVEGIIYSTDLERIPFVTPVRTFKGDACDCWVLKRVGSGFARDEKFSVPTPVKLEYLGESVACILGT